VGLCSRILRRAQKKRAGSRPTLRGCPICRGRGDDTLHDSLAGRAWPRVLSLAAGGPNANITGINIFNSEIAAKRLEFLRELLPGANRIAFLVNPADAALTETQDVSTAARTMGIQIEFFNADTIAEIDAAFETMGRSRPDAVFVSNTPFLNGRRIQLTQLATFHRLPATYPGREYAEGGGLMSYGSDIVDAYRQVGTYAGRILKSVKLADLPVVQANKIELVINAQTARMLGLIVAPSLLARADEVIE
jgi:putative tryptophan/tyrosine transport system substrate-binding protein